MKSRLPQITLKQPRAYIKVLCLFLTAIAAYWRDLLPLISEAFRIEMKNCVVTVPFMISFVLYQKRRRLQVAIATVSALAIVIVAVKKLLMAFPTAKAARIKSIARMYKPYSRSFAIRR